MTDNKRVAAAMAFVSTAVGHDPLHAHRSPLTDVYFSADVETDGPIPGPFSMLSFALVFAGTYDGDRFEQPSAFDQCFYAEMKPISDQFEQEAMHVNRIDRTRLIDEGEPAPSAMSRAAEWVKRLAAGGRPILVAYPLSFDWTWLYWYFVAFSSAGSPFNHSGCYDIKTAFSVKARLPIALSGRESLLSRVRPGHPHTHHALDDAKEQAELFTQLFAWHVDDER